MWVWALRLGTFLFRRVRRDGRDGRFDQIKTDPLRFFMTWTLQGLWVLLTMACALAIITSSERRSIEWVAVVGIAVWIIGFAIEVLADGWQRQWQRPPTADELRALVDARATYLLRAHIRRGAHDHPGRREVGGIFQQLGNAKVQKLHLAVTVNEDVARLEIPVHDEIPMEIAHRIGDLEKEPQHLLGRERLFGAVPCDRPAIDREQELERREGFGPQPVVDDLGRGRSLEGEEPLQLGPDPVQIGVEALAVERTLVLILEDLHWADLSTIDLVESVLGLCNEGPILFVNGTNDFAYPLDSYQKSYRAVPGPMPT